MTGTLALVRTMCEGKCGELAAPGRKFCAACAGLDEIFERKRLEMEKKGRIYKLGPVERIDTGVVEYDLDNDHPNRFHGWTGGELLTMAVLGAATVSLGIVGGSMLISVLRHAGDAVLTWWAGAR